MNLQDLLTKKIGLYHTDYPCSLDGVRVFAATELDITTETKLLKVSKYLYSVYLEDREVIVTRLSLVESRVKADDAWYDRLADFVDSTEH